MKKIKEKMIEQTDWCHIFKSIYRATDGTYIVSVYRVRFDEGFKGQSDYSKTHYEGNSLKEAEQIYENLD